MTAWLRRLFHRPPTIRDCMRAAQRAQCEPVRGPVLPPEVAHAVNGPELMVRTLLTKAWLEEQYGTGE